jgi:hypothetical protein
VNEGARDHGQSLPAPRGEVERIKGSWLPSARSLSAVGHSKANGVEEQGAPLPLPDHAVKANHVTAGSASRFALTARAAIAIAGKGCPHHASILFSPELISGNQNVWV